MGLVDVFKKLGSVDLESQAFGIVLNSNGNIPFAHCSNISAKIHTRKKNYYKIIFNGWENSDIAMYVAPEFNGTKAVELEATIRAKTGFERRSDYPLYVRKFTTSSGIKYMILYTDLELILTNCRDIHMELDEKEGKLCTKYIIHCADNEDDYDMYFVFYNTDLPEKVIDAITNPSWRTGSK